MEKMNEQNWSKCCEEATTALSQIFGLKGMSAKTLQSLAAAFRKEHVFPHPKRCVDVQKKQEPPKQSPRRFFEYFPLAGKMFIEFANKNSDRLTAKLMQEEVEKNIIPTLKRESIENGCFDDGSPGQEMLKKFLDNPPSDEWALKWMKQLNIVYDKFCTRRGRNGNSYLSQRMKEAWASGKYSGRKPKRKGLKKSKPVNEDKDKGKGLKESKPVNEDKDKMENELEEVHVPLLFRHHLTQTSRLFGYGSSRMNT